MDQDGILPEERIRALEQELTERPITEDRFHMREEEVRSFSQRLSTLHTLSILLAQTESLDQLCFAAVEQGRALLDFDRLSVWRFNSSNGELIGTYGTDESGGTRDERHARWSLHDPCAIEFLDSGQPVNVRHEVSHEDECGNVVGSGWSLIAAIRNDEDIIGVLCADNNISHRPLRDSDVQLLGLYACTIGHLYVRKQVELERIHVEQLLRANEEAVRVLLNATSDSAFLVDRDGIICARNRASASALGEALDDCTGCVLFDILPGETVSTWRIRFDQVIRTGKATRFEIEHRGNWYDNSIFPIADETVGVSRLAIYSEDISERKRIQQALVDREHTYRRAIGVADGVVYHKNYASDQFFYMDEGIERLVGYQPHEVTPTLFTSIIVQEVGRGAQAALTADEAIDHINSGQLSTWSADYEVRTKSGRLVWLADRALIVRDESGKPVTSLGILQDITERKRLEAQLADSMKMEAVGRLAGGIAHDFNNLLTALIGYAQLAQLSIDPDNPARRSLDMILHVAERAAELTGQLLTFARKKMVKPQLLNLNERLEAVEHLLRRLIEEHILLSLKHGPDLWTIRMDRGQLDQVLINLALNARDAMPHGGKLTLSSSNVTISQDECPPELDAVPGDYVVLTVTDTGSGMTEEVRRHIFEPFFTTKSVGKGTGLGLAMCHGIIQQAGGHIRVQSELGHGTSFHVYLPRVEGVPDPLPPTQDVSRHGSETILVVEDEPAVMDIMVRTLKSAGYTVLGALTQDEALEEALKARDALRLLVTDVVMPGMNGPELAGRVSRLAPGVRVLFVSGHTEDTLLRQDAARDRIWFLSKPFTGADLLAMVRQALDFQPNGAAAQ